MLSNCADSDVFLNVYDVPNKMKQRPVVRRMKVISCLYSKKERGLE